MHVLCFKTSHVIPEFGSDVADFLVPSILFRAALDAVVGNAAQQTGR